MTHMTDAERKQIILTTIAPLLKQYGIKGTLSMRGALKNYVMLTLQSGSIDFEKDFVGTLPKWIIPHIDFINDNFVETSREFLKLLAIAFILDAPTHAINKVYKPKNYYSIKFGVKGKQYKFIK